MAVFRIEKTKDFTVMSNHHLRNPRLSLKAKGLMSLMLSLPDNWDYTTRGLAYICRDGVDAISTTLRELEDQGYLTRERVRMPNGRLGNVEYTIHEEPQKPIAEPISPKRENPVQVFPDQVFPEQDLPCQVLPEQDNPAQLNKDRRRTDRSNIDVSNDMIDMIDDARAWRERIKENIEYDSLVKMYDVESLDEIVELILEVLVSEKPKYHIAGDEIDRDVVRNRMLKLNSSHIEYVFDCLKNTTKKVTNIKAYVLTVLFNASATADHYYQAEVNHDFSRRRRRRKA